MKNKDLHADCSSDGALYSSRTVVEAARMELYRMGLRHQQRNSEDRLLDKGSDVFNLPSRKSL